MGCINVLVDKDNINDRGSALVRFSLLGRAG